MTGLDSTTNDVDPTLPDPGAASSPICFNDGPFKGFEGIIIERRKSGRYLIQLRQGVYVEANLVEFTPRTKAE